MTTTKKVTGINNKGEYVFTGFETTSKKQKSNTNITQLFGFISMALVMSAAVYFLFVSPFIS